VNDDSEKWQWVDEDPIEKLLHPPSGAVIPNPPQSPAEALIAEGRTHFEQLRFEEAAGSFGAAVAAEPDHPTAVFDLAVCLEKLEMWKAAAFSFRRALEIDPDREQALIGLGACLLHQNEVEEALECFEQCLLSSGGPPALLGKAVALQQLSRYEEADTIYRGLLEADPEAAEPLANLIALSVARQDAAAIEDYSRRLLRVQPQSKAALQGLAMLAIRSGDQGAAIEYCTRLVEIDPDTFEGWFNLRFAQQRMTTASQPARSIA
jgi:superkiller protein 3